MAEYRLFPEGTIPECTTAQWYVGREHAAHLEDQYHRPRLLAAAQLVAHAALAWRLSTVVDLGAGDGGLLSLLGPALRSWGYDLCPANVQAAKNRGVDVRLGDALATDDIDFGDVAVATEMLEHLVDPHGFAARIARHAGVLVASSPWVETDESHYEFHTWAWDMDGYAAMLTAAGWHIARHIRVGGFQLVLARS